MLDLPKSQNRGFFSNEQILSGMYMPPLNRVEQFSPDEYEDFILEWAEGYLKNQGTYEGVRKSGGAGDKGRDIIAYIKYPDEWDNYQCKHYESPLVPTDIYVELGKLCYYTFQKDFTIPRSYYFVSPKGIGSKLGELLESPEELKRELINNWDRYCKKKVTSTQEIDLTGNFLDYINQFDFSIFKAKQPLEIIMEHRKTIWYLHRFGGEIPKSRPPHNTPPDQIDETETKYIAKLLAAYSDHKKQSIDDLQKLSSFSDLKSHFNNQREDFYRAESLKQFSRDSLPDDGGFESLKDQIYRGIRDVCFSYPHPDAYIRVIKVTNNAKLLPITNNLLTKCMDVSDKSGICHHLANEDKLTWVV